MKILHVISNLDPASGGPPQVATRLASAQAGLGHEVHLLCYNLRQIEDRIETALKGLPSSALLKVHVLPAAGPLEQRHARRASLHIGDLIRKVDITHTHGVWDPIGLATARVARREGRPYAVAPHGMLDTWALTIKPLKKKLAFALGYRRMLRGAAGLLALSEHERGCVAAGGYNPVVEIVPNGVFLEEIDPLPEKGAFHAAHPELRGEPFIVFLSRLHPVKGLSILADAFKAVLAGRPRTRLVVIGPDFGAQAGFEADVARLGIGDRVHLTGPMWGRDKFAALVDAACFCLPSEHEGFSIAITEAMASRTPVVITDTCYFPEVGAAGAGLVVRRDARELALALERVLSDPGLAAGMGEAARGLIERRYTWPRVAERSVEAYRACLDGARSAGAGAPPPAAGGQGAGEA